MPCSSGGNREVPPGGRAAPEDHERVLRSVIWAAWPDREPPWPAFLEGGAVLRITDADANNWPPGLCAAPSPTSATAGTTRRRHSPSHHTSGGAGDGPDGGYERVGPPTHAPPHGTARRMRACHLALEGVRRQRARGGTRGPAAL